MNIEALSRAELLTLLSILEGELEAQDVVIHALRVSYKCWDVSLKAMTYHAKINLFQHYTLKKNVS